MRADRYLEGIGNRRRSHIERPVTYDLVDLRDDTAWETSLRVGDLLEDWVWWRINQGLYVYIEQTIKERQ